MPISTFVGLNTSLRGLLAEQRALDEAARADREAQTDGQEQEPADGGARASQAAPGAADVAAYKRLRDAFLDLQYRSQALQLGYSEARTESLERAERCLAEPGAEAIAAQCGALRAAAAALAAQPADEDARAALEEASRSITAMVNKLDSGLHGVARQAAYELGALTCGGGELHDIVRELVRLNGCSAPAPADVLARRGQLLDRLAKLAEVAVVDAGTGSIGVTLGGAETPVVDGNALNWPVPAMAEPSGRIGALAELSAPAGTIAAYRTVLATFAGALSAHHGDGDGDTVAELYDRLETCVATDLAAARREVAVAHALADAAASRRASVTGLEEEIAGLVRLQRGYSAAARAMATTDATLEKLIDRTDRVGL